MKNAKYTVKPTTQFKKDYKLAMRRGLDIRLLEGVIADLAMGITLPEKNRDHALSGNWAGHRECHVLPDWLKFRYRNFSHYADFSVMPIKKKFLVYCLKSL
ncbi:type II toxin-antitoxin system YafQ family toxin [Schaedlerella arabinosiphila]|uniref:Type II toxin-antitoxin system YafQ family toxin n=1 Tax=Schaedlerella arabinosiphila TaxID=2044587 RepID=A0A3R8RAV2_9FIRM|nr:type II toxin-antitoxin system YafQ family toxin [Schaedlerella arabinosiphila]RRK36986.1 type II toxin-antitoxin system YafQ family toxin [Schaedlerella arabinosiphila]